MTDAVGMIGLGIMGSAMAGNLLAAGFRVVGCDIVPAARKALARQGGVAVASAGAVARRADVAITSLPSVAALDAVAADLAGAARRGLVVVETSTLPVEAKERAPDARARRGDAARLPTLGHRRAGAHARPRGLRERPAPRVPPRDPGARGLRPRALSRRPRSAPARG